MTFPMARIIREDCDILLDLHYPFKGNQNHSLVIRGECENHNKARQIISDLYHYLWYIENISSRRQVSWMGHKLIKNPMDLWIYQEIFYEVKPDVVIETGTYHGGSALYYAHLLDNLGKGFVITIDVEKFDALPEHPRIRYLIGNSVGRGVIENVDEMVKPNDSVLVILDSIHLKQHVLDELYIYSEYVTEGSYIIVEDTNLGGNPIMLNMGNDPSIAVKKFLKGNKDFVIDKERERFRVTSCPGGFLKRREHERV